MAGTTEATGINRRGIAVMDYKLEVVVIPVSDVDKAAPGDHDPLARPVRPRPAQNWEAGDHSMHHPYQAEHGHSPSAADSPSAAAVPGGA
jgi:hypothetical protein